jgi:branched-chain amino acid transport system ATP-binding protein
MLILDNIHAGYGKTRVLKGISLRVEKGEIVTILGANGAGKTTTIMTISGLIKKSRGTITLNGEILDPLPPTEIVKRGVVQIPEGRRIFSRLTVQENLEMGAFSRNDKIGIHEDLKSLFQQFPVLEERRNQLGGTLSGGEQQMLAIARALMSRPRVLLMDEPSLGLSPILVNTIFHIIHEINQKGTTVLLVEQNAKMALSVASRGYVIESGLIKFKGKSSELLENPQVKEAYLGA